MSNSFENSQEYTFREPIIRAIQSLLEVIRNRFKHLLIFAFVGGLLGLVYSFLRPTTYRSEIKIFVEDSKSAGGGLMSMVAGQIGIDVGSLMGGNSVLAGDNVLELAKSKVLLQKALQTSYPMIGKDSTYSLADQYAYAMGWKNKWASSRKVGYEVSFATNKTEFNRIEDSLWQVMFKRIIEKELAVNKPDKKLGFYTIDLETRDELLSKLLSEEIVQTTTNFFIEGKIGRLKKNVERLQRRVDSIGAMLNSKTYDAASANVENQIDINLALAQPIAMAEIKSKDKAFASVIYGELLKNLEMLKSALIQETPSIMVVDDTKIPKRDMLKWYWGIVLGMILGYTAGVLYYFRLNR
ncbi:MAG: Wzz/FepE/Etk N-terminal domain-containing protein [Bacteroidota bacterium]